MTSHYDSNQPGQYTPPQAPRSTPKKKMPLWAKIVLGVVAVPVVVVGGCMAVVGGSLAAETVANSADPAPVISTQTPIVRETPRAPKPVEVAPTKPKPTRTVPVVSVAQEQALGAAQDYLEATAYSRQGLIDQLTSSYGSGFEKADAVYAVDRVGADWNLQAVRAAKAYLRVTHYSRAGLIEQLESKHGEGFTHAQAVYGVTKAGL